MPSPHYPSPASVSLTAPTPVQRPALTSVAAPSAGLVAPPTVSLLAHPPHHLTLTARLPLRHEALRPAEARSVEAGPWFAGLSLALRQAVLARCRVLRVQRGATLLRRGQVATDWVGVAGGALGLATSGRDGRAFTLDLLGPGDWYGDVALIDGSAVDLDIVAQAHSTVLLMDRAAMLHLLANQLELRSALLHLDCRRLRHMFKRLEEVQTLPLSQRVALQLQRLLRQFGRPVEPSGPGMSTPQVQQIELTLTQGDLASQLCASRQRINGTLRQLQALGILGDSHGRIQVTDPQRLGDVAQGRLVLDSSGG